MCRWFPVAKDKEDYLRATQGLLETLAQLQSVHKESSDLFTPDYLFGL